MRQNSLFSPLFVSAFSKKAFLFLLPLLCMTSLVPLHGETNEATELSPTKKEKILKLLELTGTKTVMKTVMNQMITAMKAQNSSLPSSFFDELTSDENLDELLQQLIPIYHKYYSESDVDAMITFYESPVGKKVTKTLPQVSQESMQVGQAWGMKLGQKIARAIQAEKQKQKEEEKSEE